MPKAASNDLAALHKFAALVVIAIDIPHGTLSRTRTPDTGPQDQLKDKVGDIEAQIKELKAQAERIEAKGRTMEDLLPRMLDVLAEDGFTACPDLDPPKVAFFAL